MVMGNRKLVFGFRTVVGVPTCPCNDPGNYMLMEQSLKNPLDVYFWCWCGRHANARFDSMEELNDFLAKNGVTTEEKK